MAKMKPCGIKPNCACTLNWPSSARHPEPLNYQCESSEVWQAIEPIMSRLPRTKCTSEVSSPNYRTYEVATRVCGFIDRVEWELDLEKKQVHLKSAAQSGLVDFGVNERRVKDLLRQLEESLPVPS